MNGKEGVWEGLGGPVNTTRPSFDDIDPTLAACCRREVESNRQRSALEGTLRRHDVVAQAERRKKHLIPNLSWGSGCRCCYDPNSDGGEYRALIEAREKQRESKIEEKEAYELENDPDEEATDSDDSDDEFDYLLDEDFPSTENDNDGDKALNEIEDRRRAELEMLAYHQEASVQHGYGAHRQMHPSRVLRAAGLGSQTQGSVATSAPGVVLHLVDPDASVSGELDLCLETLANTYRGSKFLRSDGRATLLLDADFAKQYLPRLSPDRDMPTLVAIRDGVVVATCPRLSGLVDTSTCQVETSAVKDWLEHAGVLITHPPPMDELCRIRPEELALYDFLPLSNTKENQSEELYDCGMPGCNKTFAHNHVGIKTDQQDGLVVKGEDVLA